MNNELALIAIKTTEATMDKLTSSELATFILNAHRGNSGDRILAELMVHLLIQAYREQRVAQMGEADA